MDEKEIEIIKMGFNKKESYEDVAKKINDYRMKKSKTKYHLYASPGGIPYSYANIGLISNEEAKKEYDNFKNKQNKKIKKERANADNKSWYKQRKLALERDGNKCNICDSNEKLVVHHIISFKENKSHELDNLIVLCQKCHGIIGKNKLWISADWVDYNAKEIFETIVIKYLQITSKMNYDVAYGHSSSPYNGPFLIWKVAEKGKLNLNLNAEKCEASKQ